MPLISNTPMANVFEEHFSRLDEAVQRMEGQQTPQDRERILAERAHQLAEPIHSQTEQVDLEKIEVLVFRVGGERYALPVKQVDTVFETKTLAALLGTPRHILGAFSVRALIVPVLDLRQILGLSGGGMTDLKRALVVNDGEEVFALAVEAIEGSINIPREGWERPMSGPFLHVTGDRLAILDIKAIGRAATSSSH